MTTKAYFFALLLLAASLLTGCNTAIGDHASAVQSTGEHNKTAGKQQDIPADTALAEERARLAEERAKLAEEKAELEKQKREFAEQQLKQQQESQQHGEAKESSDETSSAVIPQRQAAPVERASVPRHRRVRPDPPNIQAQDADEGESSDSCTCPSDDNGSEDGGNWPEGAEPPGAARQYFTDEAAAGLRL
ncbi:MAG: hypothetical protein JOZ02_06235 [Acidobacteria bacterium]|nr:hypothetical protein [Acidobacteriota bacterium]